MVNLGKTFENITYQAKKALGKNPRAYQANKDLLQLWKLGVKIARMTIAVICIKTTKMFVV